MEMGLGLVQQQQLKLIMTPELRQSIAILQYSSMELTNYLREQVNENPLIELEEPTLLQPKEPGKSKGSEPYQWTDGEAERYGDFKLARDDYVNPIDYYSDRYVTLHQYLDEQIGYMKLTSKETRLLKFLIGNVNDNGYLEVHYDMLPKEYTATWDEWEKAISTLQQLEPHGVGARNLMECLLLQLEHTDWKDENAEKIIRFHLQDLAANRYQKIASSLKISIKEVQLIADLIKGLHPKPGILFQSSYDARFIIPDVYVEKAENGRYLIQINDAILPRLSINQEYQQLFKEHTDAKAFFEQRLQQLNWINKSLTQRKQTILKVTEVIVEEQRRFFEEGTAYLKPLTLREVARKLGVNESTISRATNQKYVQTPLGIFELKYFFTNGLSNQEGEDTSSHFIKERIKQLVEVENKLKPLSDQKLVELLNAEKIEVARRTVAKYREELGILSSTQRKRYE